MESWPSVGQMLAMSNDDLARVDPLVMNLVVAKGIPSLADLDIERYVRLTDGWAGAIKQHLPAADANFRRTPGRWQNDRDFSRLAAMCWYVGDVLKIRYREDQRSIIRIRYTDPTDVFLCGVMDSRRGTCGNMAALHVAIGWRLGWPVSLACVASHFICRFDNGRKTFNIEATNHGDDGTFSAPPDDYYRKEYKLPQKAIDCGSDLRAVKPRELLGLFLGARARHLENTDRRAGLLTSSPLVDTSTYGYDQAGRLTSLSHDLGTVSVTPEISLGWGYDQANRVTQFTTNASGESRSYGYDTRSQLTSAGGTGYSYSLAGNRTDSSQSSPTLNRLTSDATYTYTYDDEGNRKTRSQTGEYTEYSWDNRNRLTGVTTYDKADPATRVKLSDVQYQYDALGRRISRTVNNGNDSTIDRREFYVYDGDDVVFDFVDSDGDGSGQTLKLDRRYLKGPAIDQILAEEDQNATFGTANRVLWDLADNQGTIRDLVKYDSGGNAVTVVNHIAYDAWGKETSVVDANGTATTLKTRYGYTGRELDSDTGLQYNRKRWYDPAVGRWISEDPIGFDGGDANLYRYVGNSPLVSADPFGRAPDDFESRERAWQEYDSALAQHFQGFFAYEQALLDYYHRVMRQIILVGDALTGGGPKNLAKQLPWYAQCACQITEGRSGSISAQQTPQSAVKYFPTGSPWENLKRAMQYSMGKYHAIGFFGITLVPWSSANLPFSPGIAIDERMFFGADEASAIGLLIHEPQHDFGFGFLGTGLFHDHITPLEVTWTQVVDFLHAVQCDGTKELSRN